MAKIVCDIPADFNPRLTTLMLSDSEGKMMKVPFKVGDVKLKQTKEDKLKQTRMYRDRYLKKPEVQEKLRKRMSSPEYIEKRKEYARRADVKEKKKASSTRNRAIFKHIKINFPDIILQAEEEVIKNGLKT